MLVIQDAWKHESFPRPCVVTVGNFDGIHRGQGRVLARVRARAQAIGATAAVVTFEPHPLLVLRPERPVQRITTPAQKQELIRLQGMDLMAIIDFTPEFATTPATGFVEDLLHRRLGAAEIYIGSHFGFGHRREGNLELLRRLSGRLGYRVEGIPELHSEGSVISSTRIRQAVREGDVGRAADLLGRAFAITGVVVEGEGRGRVHGWPTLNVQVDHELVPADGVYAAQVWLPGLVQTLDAVTNVGRRPTFPDGDRRVVESHLFDFDGDLYGERVELAFVERLRGERRFPSVEDLTTQIGRDAQQAREYLSRDDCSTLVPTLGI